MHLLLDAVFGAIVAAFGSAASRRRAGWAGDGAGTSPVRVAAAVAVVATTLPLAYMALKLGQLALELLDDPMLMFLGLLIIGPMALFVVLGAITVVATAAAVAPGVAVGSLQALVRAWVFVIVALLQAITYLHVGANGVAAGTFAIGLATAALLVAVRRDRPPASDGPRRTV